ncbi:MAG: DUF1572 family protein [Flavobacterium sp.]|uniref:DUF1572 family protein n=1 Tax=Flavobacterium sp. TaxID=239 RepID=UPI00260D3CAB|nr:DUF1572 family protein [Flavobacterium sp.]MDD5150284.1 DUF1572 family protein [Flavobacterium sp.]
MQTLLKTLFIRNLNQLKLEIESYKTEADLWKTTPEIANSGGNLCLHLIGNLNHFIGATLGNTGYIRQRDLEFSEKNIPREILIQNIENVIKIVSNTLDNLNENDFKQEYPSEVFGSKMATQDFITYLTTHLAYHLGQINYHRRFINSTN